MGTILKQEVAEYLKGENQIDTPANTQLFEAASAGNIQQLKAALEEGANSNYVSKEGDMLFTLHAAARSPNSKDGSALCVKELVEKGARVSCALISNRNEPIHEAANAGATEVCRVLVEASPKSAESENSYGNTPLLAAARSGSAEVVQLLLEKGAGVNKVNHRGSTALHIACFLASNGGELDASVDPYLKIGGILLCNDELEIDTADITGCTPLHVASMRGCDELVKLLIDSGASLTAKTAIDSKGRGARTALTMAKWGGRDSTMKIIEEAMAAEKVEIVTKTKAKKLLEGL